MADLGANDPHAGETVEIAVRDLHDRLATDDALRDALPGLEPDREITDWGRSERVERVVDRTLVGFLYHYWFRVESEGVDNVPSSGGAMLVANHGGALPPAGAMIAKALAQEHSRPRPLHLSTERTFAGVPGVGMLVTKLGGVSAHPANLHRLLFDEGQLVLVFPEGRSRKALSERYRLRKFGGDDYLEAAMRARAPIIPIAVLGAEEAVPVFGRVSPLSRLTRLPRVPVTPPVPLPAKFRIRFLEPVDTDGLGDMPWDDRGLMQSLSHDIRALIQENLLEMVAQRKSVWLG